MTENKHKQQVVISMTSFPAAIKFAEQAVRSLLNGSVLPDKLILYVTLSQFAEGEIPETLLALAKQNPVFEIRNYDRDIRSYRKLIPALVDFPEAIIARRSCLPRGESPNEPFSTRAGANDVL